MTGVQTCALPIYLQQLTKINHDMSGKTCPTSLCSEPCLFCVLILSVVSSAVHFPHSTPAATFAVKKVREKRARAGPITGEWMVEDHLAALAARVKPMKVIGIDLLSAAIRTYRGLWPGKLVPTAIEGLVEALMESEERLGEWRESAGRAGADEVLQFVLSWYEDINLEAVQTLRAGSKWISDPEHIRRRQERAYSLAQYASVHTFHDDPFPRDEVEEEDEEEADADIDEAEPSAGQDDVGADPQASTSAPITSTSAPPPEADAPESGTGAPESGTSAP